MDPVSVMTYGSNAKDYQFWTEVGVGEEGWYAEEEDDPNLVVQPWLGDDDGFYYSYGWRLKDIRALQSIEVKKPFRIVIFIRHHSPVFPEISSAQVVSLDDLNLLFRHFEMMRWILTSDEISKLK